MNNLQKLAYSCLSIAFFLSISCSSDDSSNDQTRLRIKAESTYTPGQSRNNADVAITEFKLNIKEIEIELDEDFIVEGEDDDVDSQDEIELQGPFELDLLTGTSNITTIELPEAVYEEIEFEFDINTDASSDLLNKTVLLEGTIDGTPFTFWHNFEEDVEVDYEDNFEDITISEGLNTVVISFDLDAILSEIDLTTATDNDANGIIEISPMDLDGNNALAELLKEKLKDVTELLDD